MQREHLVHPRVQRCGKSSAWLSCGGVWVINWSAASRGLGSNVLGCKKIVMNCFSILLSALLRHFGQSCCLLWVFCCKTVKMLHSWLFAHKLRLKKFPDLGRVKTEAGKCSHGMFEKVINPSWNEK